MVGPHREVQGSGDERGVALIIALFFTVVIAGLTATGAMILKAHSETNRINWARKNQALQVARSGLNEGLVWLRRQTSQPVLTFAPVLDNDPDPPILDTLDPDIGLVREFTITDKIRARYELWKRWETDPNPTRLAWRRRFECEDVSAARAQASAGTVWRLRSIGYVYNCVDPLVPYNVAPNSVIASHIAVNEVRRLVIALPGHGALNVGDGNSCHINTNGRIIGGDGAGVCYPEGTGEPTVGPPSAERVTGDPGQSPVPDYDDSYEAVFSVGFEQLQSMATLVVSDPAGIPNPMPSMGLVVIDCGSTVSFDAARPLIGTAIVVVRGNCSLSAGNNSNFSGMLYVEGNLSVRAPSEINGSVVCTGNVTVQGVPDYATINFDPDVLEALMRQLGNYRVSNTTFLPRVSR